MTVDPSVIGDRLRRLDEYLVTLRHLARLSREELTQDPVPLGSTERYLQVAIEACLDIANHIIAAERLRAPRDYADAFSVLAEADVIPVEFLPVVQRWRAFAIGWSTCIGTWMQKLSMRFCRRVWTISIASRVTS